MSESQFPDVSADSSNIITNSAIENGADADLRNQIRVCGISILRCEMNSKIASNQLNN